MKILKLGDLLTHQQVEDLDLIWKGEPDDIRRINLMRIYLRKLEKELEAKGVLPDYLAYYMEFIFNTHYHRKTRANVLEGLKQSWRKKGNK